MITHHLTIEHAARQLHETLCGMRLVRAWSQQKYLATLIFADDSHEIPVVINVSGVDSSITVRSQAHRALRNSVDVFPELIGEVLAAVVKVQDDRVVSFVFEHHVMYGELFSAGRGNIVLCDGSIIINSLRNRAERINNEFVIAPAIVPEPFTRNDTSLLKDLATCSLHLGRYYAQEVCNRAGVESSLAVGALTPEQQHVIRKTALELLELCRSEPRFLILTRDTDLLLSLLPLQGWSISEEYHSVLDAIRLVSTRRRGLEAFRQERERNLRRIDTGLAKLRRTHEALLQDEAAPLRPARYRSWADTLMAQPDVQAAGFDHRETSHVVTGVIERIPLRAELTILENASALYAKAKASERASSQRAARIPELERQISELIAERFRIENAITAADLPREKINMESQQSPSTTPKFREFRLDDTHTVYVGRNASNNDELTMKFARQQDWWMHVRGASGSHAVLRGVKGDRIPKSILEKAAAITAYYSQARNASYVPVIYTQRKYVRKPKGANVGAVVVDREQTVMVRPALPDGMLSDE